MSAAEPPHRYRSYVALGDSFTEGLQDDLGPAGRHRGWADRVAAALAVAGGGPVRYANLAVRGRLLDAVVREQVPVAEALAPDLVSFQAAGNDLLRPRVDLPGVLARYERAVERLRGTVPRPSGGRGRVRRCRPRRRGRPAGPPVLARGPPAPRAGRPRAGRGGRPRSPRPHRGRRARRPTGLVARPVAGPAAGRPSREPRRGRPLGAPALPPVGFPAGARRVER